MCPPTCLREGVTHSGRPQAPLSWLVRAVTKPLVDTRSRDGGRKPIERSSRRCKSAETFMCRLHCDDGDDPAESSVRVAIQIGRHRLADNVKWDPQYSR